MIGILESGRVYYSCVYIMASNDASVRNITFRLFRIHIRILFKFRPLKLHSAKFDEFYKSHSIDGNHRNVFYKVFYY